MARGRSRAPPTRQGRSPDGALLLDLGLLPDPVAQVIELGPPHVAQPVDLDLGQDRRVDRERALHADAEAHLADGEGLPHAGALAADDDALEDLDPLSVALDHPDVHLQRVTRAEPGNVVTETV